MGRWPRGPFSECLPAYCVTTMKNKSPTVSKYSKAIQKVSPDFEVDFYYCFSEISRKLDMSGNQPAAKLKNQKERVSTY